MLEPVLDHARLQEMVAAFADHELPPEQMLAVEEHLKSCTRCQRELEAQRRISRALAHEPPARGASARLRRRVEEIGAPSSRFESRRRWVAVGAAAAVALGVAAGSLLQRNRGAPAVDALVIRDSLADCRRVMGRNFPKKADLAGTAAGLGFPVRALPAPAGGPFSTWRTTLAGAPAAGLAYRWRGGVVVQYVVSRDVIRREPLLAAALRDGSWSTTAQGQAILVQMRDDAATVLVGDGPVEDLRQLML